MLFYKHAEKVATVNLMSRDRGIPGLDTGTLPRLAWCRIMVYRLSRDVQSQKDVQDSSRFISGVVTFLAFLDWSWAEKKLCWAPDVCCLLPFADCCCSHHQGTWGTKSKTKSTLVLTGKRKTDDTWVIQIVIKPSTLMIDNISKTCRKSCFSQSLPTARLQSPKLLPQQRQRWNPRRHQRLRRKLSQ